MRCDNILHKKEKSAVSIGNRILKYQDHRLSRWSWILVFLKKRDERKKQREEKTKLFAVAKSIFIIILALFGLILDGK